MKAMVANEYGGPEVYQLQEVNIPTLKSNEILVKVSAASVTRADTMMRTGKPYISRLFVGLNKPKHPIPGTGFSGTVVASGDSVAKFKVGDEVFGETTTNFSTNAEYVAVTENGVVHHRPENLSSAAAAVFCDGPLTSYNFLKEIGEIKKGQKVLINGASGALGMAAVQLAKYFGAEVTGVCSSRNIGLVRSFGADYTIDYTEKDFTQGKKQYDIIYDCVGKSSFEACKNVLTENGQYLSPVLDFGLLLTMMRTSVIGDKKAKFAATGALSNDVLSAMLEKVIQIFKEGHLKTHIDRQYPLENLVEAHTYISGGRKRGNVVLQLVASHAI